MAKLIIVLVASLLALNSGVDARRIVGGNLANQGQFPHIAALLKTELSGARTFFCAGSLIAPTWVVTAAHCLTSHTVASTRVRTGELDFTVGTEFEQLVSVKQFIPHPLYSAAQSLNDIALVELSEAINYIPDVVGPVALPFNRTDYSPGEDCVISGWGSAEEGAATERRLRFAFVPVVSDSECEAAYTGLVSPSMLCAGYPQGGVDSCQGDSGGPMSCGDVQDSLDGIVSWGQGCARPGFPGVYTQVSYFTNWIADIVGIENISIV